MAVGFTQLSDFEAEINSSIKGAAYFNKAIDNGEKFNTFGVNIDLGESIGISFTRIPGFDFNTRWDESKPLYPQIIERLGDAKFYFSAKKIDMDKLINSDFKYMRAKLSFIQSNSIIVPLVFTSAIIYNTLPTVESNCIFSTHGVMRGDTSINTPVEMLIPLNMSCMSQQTVNVQISGDSLFHSVVSTLKNSSNDDTQVTLSLRDVQGNESDKISTSVDNNKSVELDIIGKTTPSKAGTFYGKGYIKVSVN